MYIFRWEFMLQNNITWKQISNYSWNCFLENDGMLIRSLLFSVTSTETAFIHITWIWKEHKFSNNLESFKLLLNIHRRVFCIVKMWRLNVYFRCGFCCNVQFVTNLSSCFKRWYCPRWFWYCILDMSRKKKAFLD